MPKLINPLSKFTHEAGCDEAGRGCLAGPVVAAAVILSPKTEIIGLNDSKKLSPLKRQALRLEIKEKALDFALGFVDNDEIDQINILNASFLAMHRALDQLKKVEYIAVDGNRFNPYKNLPFECVIKGDSKIASIAAASVLAKTYRDEYMEGLASAYPNYGWEKNKGYPTKLHRAGIAEFGSTKFHRKSFTLTAQQKLPL